MKHVVILGGGFAGLTCALELAKSFGNGTGAKITLVDKEPYHWYHADFYEVAASPEEITDIQGLKQSVALQLSEICKANGIAFVRDEVLEVHAEKKQVRLKAKHVLHFDYLVSALGSVACYYGIPGAERWTLPLKSFSDALRIRNNLEFLVQRHRQDTTKKQLDIMVVGGGFSGVELAAELAGVADFLAWKYVYPREKINICILEGSPTLMPGMENRVIADVTARLQSLGVRFELNSKITEVGETLLSLEGGERLGYDMAIWTAGIKSAPVSFYEILPKDYSGRVLVTDTLQVEGFHNLFFIGDQASKLHDPYQPTALNACQQARYVAYALGRVMLNRQPKPYIAKQFAYIIPLGGKYALYAGKRLYTLGYAGYLLRLLRTFRYYSRLVGAVSAIRFLRNKQRLYNRPLA